MTDPEPTHYPYLGENALTFLLSLLSRDFAKKTDLSDTDTTYAISINGTTVTLTGSDGNSSTITIPSQVTVDSSITQNGTNPVEGGAIYTALSDKPSNAEMAAAISAALAGITQVDFQVYQTLPVSGEKGVFYLVPNSGTGSNVYDEYVYTTYSYSESEDQTVDSGKTYYSLSGTTYSEVDSTASGYSESDPSSEGWYERSGSEGFEKIGSTSVDLSGYWQKTELVEMTNTEVADIWNAVMNPSTQESQQGGE